MKVHNPRKAIVVLLSAYCFFLLSADKIFAAETTIFLFSESYPGTLDNDIFTSEDLSFSLSAKEWTNGAPEGPVVISHNDGKTVEAMYESGVMNGVVTEYSSDGSYRVYNCSSGMPTGLITTYSSSGECLGYDYFYQGESVRDLIKDARNLPYRELVNSEVCASPVIVQGTVLAQLESEDTSYTLITDSDNCCYIVSFFNHGVSTYNQAIVPNLRIGQDVTAYGYYVGLNSFYNIINDGIFDTTSPSTFGLLLNDGKMNTKLDAEYLKSQLSQEIQNARNSFEKQNKSSTSSSVVSDKDYAIPSYSYNTYPVIQLFYAEADDSFDIDQNQRLVSYENVSQNPYLFFGLSCELTGEVVHCSIDTDSNTVLFDILCNQDELYGITFAYEDISSVPLIGEEVTVIGTYDGNEKIYTESDTGISENDDMCGFYYTFPRIVAKEIQFK